MQTLYRSLWGHLKSAKGNPVGLFGLGCVESNVFVARRIVTSNIQQLNVDLKAYSAVIFPKCISWQSKVGLLTESSTSVRWGPNPVRSARCISTSGTEEECASEYETPSNPDGHPRIKMKRLDKTARYIMQILDREAVAEVKAEREVLTDIRPGYIIQFKLEVPENKRRNSIIKGTVIARRNAGLNTTFRIRRHVAGIGVESVYHLYSPNIKELKVVEKKPVRRAKLYYMRDRLNPFKKGIKKGPK